MSGRPKYTMKDVARLASVSTATVSAVINGAPAVSPQRKQQVERAMAALDYQPDAIARSLKTGRSQAVGLIVPDITNMFYPEVIRGAEEVGQAAGYSVLLCDSVEDPLIEERHLSALISRRVDGILLACCADSRAYDTVARRGIPVIFIDRLPPGTATNSVSTDNVEAGYLAAQHLIQLGHQRIGMIAGRTELSPHRDRLEGFRKAMQQAHLPILSDYLICEDVQVEDGVAGGRKLLGLPNPPTAILASNNKILLGLMQTVNEKKLNIPRDLSVLGFDDYLWNQYFSPTLTAIAQPTRDIGRQSLELLLQLIEKPMQDRSQPTCLSLPPELRVRKSTAPPGERKG